MSIWQVALFGLVSGMVGTGLGGLFAFVPGLARGRFLSLVLDYAAGAMIAVVCFELLPGALERGGLGTAICGLVTGIVLTMFTERLVARGEVGGEPTGTAAWVPLGLVTAASLALHNLPEGLAVGSGMEVSVSLGAGIALTIFLHDLPEGMAVALPLRAGGWPAWKAALFAAITGIPMGLGALIGAALGRLSPMLMAFCLALAGGAMLQVVFSDMIPASRQSGKMSPLASILGVMTGFLAVTWL